MGISRTISRFAEAVWNHNSETYDLIYNSTTSVAKRSPVAHEMTRIAEIVAIVFIANPKACGWGIVAGFMSAISEVVQIYLTQVATHKI